MTLSIWQQISFVARRSITRTFRQPALIAPNVIFPLLLMTINAKGLNAATRLPGFPTDSYVDFAVAVTFMQGGLFAAIAAGTELATDIESGFLNRLQLTPLRGTAILAGQMAGALAVALLSAVVYIVAGLLIGVDFKTGVPGMLALLGMSVLVGIAFGGIGMLMAARTGQAEAVQGLFPLIFVLFFLSSLNLPRPLIKADWFRTITDINPLSYMVEGLRALVITGWDGTALWRFFLATGSIAIVALLAASAGLKTRMGRT